MTGAAVLGCAGPVLGRDEAAFFRQADPWGFILFARNVDSPEQLRRLTGDLRAAVGRAAPVFVDQEGGRVQRLRPPHWRDWPPPLDMVRAAGPRAGRAMHLRARIIAAELRACGLDGNCAPCADIATDDTHPFLKNRCHGNDLDTVVQVSREVAAGLLAGGVLPVMKHIPGHGRARGDTHLALPAVAAPLADLAATDFAAFAALADLPLGMTAHVVYAALDPDTPGTLSPAVIGAIRGTIGFDGLLMTDDIAMGALSGPVAARAAAARAAGCDVVLHCNGDLAEMEAVAAAAGALSPRGAARAARALARRLPAPQVDIAALDADLRSVMMGAQDDG